MERFKIEHFEREHPRCPFPAIATLTPEEAAHVRVAFARRIGAEETVGGQELLDRLLTHARPIEGANANDAEFDLARILTAAGLRPRDQVDIQWGTWSNIDRLALAALSRHFTDIWYPSSDDVEIFDDTFSWLLFVRHYGGLSVIRFNDGA